MFAIAVSKGHPSMSDFVAEDNSLYATPKFWDDEYKKCQPGYAYEWFTGCDDPKMLEGLWQMIPSQSAKIINLGCGISHIQDIMFDHGYKDITNVDVSPKCIELMSQTDTRGMKWGVADVLEPFPYPKGSFDFALDKGTLDALITDNADKWEIEDSVYSTSDRYFQNVYDSLSANGVFIQITFGQPHFRKRLFERPQLNWKVTAHTFLSAHSFHFFIYECRKSQ